MAAFSLMLPAGFVLVSAAGLGPRRAWDAAMGALAASGISVFVYWAVGFGLQFGGIGLVYTQPELQALVWEWSALSSEWGSGWGMAGLSGWFLSGSNVTPLVYVLFLAHLPWVMTASMIPVLALRGRAPATATLLIAIFVGGFLYPIAGNWVQGGGWLSALGRNLALGHGLIDYAGTGSVFLVASAFALPALLIWVPRQQGNSALADLPATHLPLLCIAGSLMVMLGCVGWLTSNPLQLSVLDEVGLIRGSVSIILSAGGGVVVPVLYTWFVTGSSDPLMSGRGFTAGAIAGLAAAPFVQPGSAILIGAIVGGLIPFVTYVSDGLLRLDDATGILHMCIVPAVSSLILVGFFADGVSGAGWQLIGAENYLGVTGQGVSGLLTADGYQPDFPAQLQAQVVGVLALGLWGFLMGLLVCAPLSIVYRAVGSIPGFAGQEAPGYGQPAYDQAGYPSDLQENPDFQTSPGYGREQHIEERYADQPYPMIAHTDQPYADEAEHTSPYGEPESPQPMSRLDELPDVQPRFTALTRRRPPKEST